MSVGPDGMSPQDLDDVDLESVYSQFCALTSGDSNVIFQNVQRLSATDNLFYTDVLVHNVLELRAMLDSGSMACSLSTRVLPLLEQANVVVPGSISPTSVVLIGCGGSRTSDEALWGLLGESVPLGSGSSGGGTLLQLLAAVETWRGSECPDKVGTVKLKHAVTLEPMQEHLVWGRLPSHTCISAGSTVVVEPSESRTVPRTVIVGRVVMPLWGDG